MEIKMARGDLYTLPFALFIDDVQSELELDEVYFTVKRRYTERRALLQKKLTDGGIVSDGHGNYTLTIEPEDTQAMEFGTYDFDIEVVKEANPAIKRTFVGTIELTKEVTHHINEGVESGG